MKRRYQTWIVVSALVLAQVSCGKRESNTENPAPREKYVHAIGYVEPRERLRRMVFEAQGVIGGVLVEMGDEVKKGDVLAVLRDDEQAGRVGISEKRVGVLVAELDLLNAGAHPDAIAAMEAEYEAAVVDREFRQRERERLGKLAEVRGVSGSVAAEAANVADLAELEVRRLEALLAALQNQTRKEESALAEVRLAEARQVLAVERVLLDQRKLRAPDDGVVVEVFKRAGELVSHWEGDPVILFAPASPLEVRVEVDEAFWGRFHEGADARVVISGGVEVEGRVRVMKRAMGNKSVFSRAATERMDLKVFEVWIGLPETVAWPIGMEVDVKIREEAGDE